MNNLDAILEVAIGVVLTWLILSVATVEVQDLISKWLNRRANFLEKSILDMFRGEQDFVDQFYEQPVIKALYKKNIFGKPKKPDYIPNQAFAEAVFEMFVNLGTEKGQLPEETISLQRIINKMEEINEQNQELGYFIKRLLPKFDGKKSVAKLRDAHDKVAEFKTNAENWFDTSMTRASYWYKENAKTLAFFIGFGLAITFNIDSIQITEQLWREPTLRQSLVAQAQTVDENTGPASVAELEDYYEDLKLPVGWNKDKLPAEPIDWMSKVVGFLISGLAAMQGAPFWFDMLRKLIQFKGSSKSEGEPKTTPPPPVEKPEEKPQAVG